jgi:hypothetical protein
VVQFLVVEISGNNDNDNDIDQEVVQHCIVWDANSKVIMDIYKDTEHIKLDKGDESDWKGIQDQLEKKLSTDDVKWREAKILKSYCIFTTEKRPKCAVEGYSVHSSNSSSQGDVRDSYRASIMHKCPICNQDKNWFEHFSSKQRRKHEDAKCMECSKLGCMEKKEKEEFRLCTSELRLCGGVQLQLTGANFFRKQIKSLTGSKCIICCNEEERISHQKTPQEKAIALEHKRERRRDHKKKNKKEKKDQKSQQPKESGDEVYYYNY